MSKPARSAMAVAATNWAFTRSMSARSMARGTWLAFDHAMALADMTGQLPDLRGALSFSQPSWVEAFRPAWPIWQQIFAGVSACTKSTSRRQAASWLFS